MRNNKNKKLLNYQPYYKGALHTINHSSTKNHLYLNKSKNKINSIRLHSPNSPLMEKKNKSQDKFLKINTNVTGPFSNNYLTINNTLPTSVGIQNQNLLYSNNKSMNYGQSNDLNYQSNNIPFQRRRKIIYEADNELAEEYDKLRKIWKDAGVTDVYMDNFETVTNNKNNSKEEILQYLKNEESQMIKFKEEMLKIVSEVIKRENDINNIKELNKKYLDIKTKMNINPKDEIKMEEYNNEKIKLEKDIATCLSLLRLHGINIVAAFKKFNMRYDHLLNAGKVDLDYLKSKYGFDKNYLIKLKTDLDFLRDTEIGEIYLFSSKGKDPFLVSLSIEQTNNKYKTLPISEDMMKQIKIYNHLLNEVEIYSMMRNDYSMSNALNFSSNISHTFKYGGFLNNLNKNEESNFSNIILNTTPNNSKKLESKIKLNNNINNIKYKEKLQNKKNDFYGKQKPIKILPNNNISNIKEYENLKKNLTGPYYSQVENDKNQDKEKEKDNISNSNGVNNLINMPKINSVSNSMVEEEKDEIIEDDIIKEVESRVNKEVINKLFEVENRVKRQVEEKLRKDQERIKEEEKRLKKRKREN